MVKRKLKIVLICDHSLRELPALLFLKRSLEKVLKAEVSILGSLAEAQRIYYLISRIQPDIVFISQIQETIARNIAEYVRKSGGQVCIVPVELSYARSNLFWLFNKNQKYNYLVDFYFLPGEVMYKDVLDYTDINKDKLFVVGSPRMDLLSGKNDRSLLNRVEFCKRYSIPINRINIFIYTTFVSYSKEYLEKENSFQGNTKSILRLCQSMDETKKKYIEDIKKLCVDFPEYNIILKPHPLEEDSEYRRISADNFFVISGEFFSNTLKSVDLAIHWNSTITTECWIRNIKIIEYAPITKYRDLLSDFNGGNPVVQDYDHLKKAIIKYINKPLDNKYLLFQKRYLKEWYYNVDGQSGNRIAKIIAKHATKNKHFSDISDESILYIQRNSIRMRLFVRLEKILGIRLLRFLIALFKRGFQWKYVVNNYVQIINSKFIN